MCLKRCGSIPSIHTLCLFGSLTFSQRTIFIELKWMWRRKLGSGSKMNALNSFLLLLHTKHHHSHRHHHHHPCYFSSLIFWKHKRFSLSGQSVYIYRFSRTNLKQASLVKTGKGLLTRLLCNCYSIAA